MPHINQVRRILSVTPIGVVVAVFAFPGDFSRLLRWVADVIEKPDVGGYAVFALIGIWAIFQTWETIQSFPAKKSNPNNPNNNPVPSYALLPHVTSTVRDHHALVLILIAAGVLFIAVMIYVLINQNQSLLQLIQKLYIHETTPSWGR